MDNSGTSWISEMGLEDPSNGGDEYDILDFFDEDLSSAALFANINGSQDDDMSHQNYDCSSWSQEYFNSFNSSSSNTPLFPRNDSTNSIATSSIFLDGQNMVADPALTPAHLDEMMPQYYHNNFNMNNNDINTSTTTTTTTSVTPSPSILVFGSSKDLPVAAAPAQVQQSTTKKTTRTRPPSQTYDHIIAERKRREQLSQQFVALSSIVPGLKKMDKTSVLGDAINYLKELKEKVKGLEEKATNQKMESMVLIKKKRVVIEDEDEGEDQEVEEEGGEYDEQQLPNIEAKLCDKKVLLRIQCEKNKRVLGKLFTQLQMMNMTVINTNVTPFGNMALDITIVAEVDKEVKLMMKDLVKNIRSALLAG